MPSKYKFSVTMLFVLAVMWLLPAGAFAQTSNVPPRITEVVNDSKLTVLHGNTHPLAQAQFDRGPAPSDLPMERMQLVLKRSPVQEASLEKLMAEQQDKSSANYHKWLTPVQFGQEFGPASQDIQTITSWLTSHGFQINHVSNSRTVIQFSGTAGQVQEALHTPIHKFVVNNEEHWANATDPSIPTALTPVVVGVATLHNFYPKPTARVKHATKSTVAGKVKPQVTFQGSTACGLTAVVDCFDLGPADFATIYNVQPLWNAGIDGTGETIAIVSDSNINPLDVSDFRSIFGLPVNAPVVTVPPVTNCSAPGLTSDEVEAILDVEWSGAVAKNATINLVTCASTNTSFGGDLAASYIVDFPNTTFSGTSTGFAPILSESFGECELGLGSTLNAFYNSTWQQAAGEGITVLISSGDSGSAGCDVAQPATPTNCGFSSSAQVQVAQCGLAVSGISSTPYNLAVGGTEFNDVNNPQEFWSDTNASNTLESALGYIPETAYNDTCTSPIVVSQADAAFGDATAEETCNDPNIQDSSVSTSPNNGLVTVAGGGGGASNCTTFNGTVPGDCTGGYLKPTWQVALTPADGKRDVPDISFFAGDGTISGSAYVLCERDANGSGSNTPCDLEEGEFLNAGGTSVSTQVFAGIMALVDQKNESAEGLINPVLYSLATGGNTCTSAASPSSSCIFYDVADDSTNAMPCITGSPNCLTVTAGDAIGVITGYTAAAGYDQATGLGSINVANLVNAPTVWNQPTSTQGVDFTLSLTNPNSPPTITTAGGTGTASVTVTAENGFTGVVTLACSDLPSGVTCSAPSVTGSGTSTVTFTSSAAAVLNPVGGSNRVASPGTGAKIALVCALSLCLMLMGFSSSKRRLSLTFALMAFALVFANVGCGGGGGGTTTPPPGTPVGTNVVITATSGSIHRSVAVLLTVTN
jgi:subtilase family serine protease